MKYKILTTNFGSLLLAPTSPLHVLTLCPGCPHFLHVSCTPFLDTLDWLPLGSSTSFLLYYSPGLTSGKGTYLSIILLTLTASVIAWSHASAMTMKVLCMNDEWKGKVRRLWSIKKNHYRWKRTNPCGISGKLTGMLPMTWQAMLASR